MEQNIILEGGKGGGGSSFSEQDNTLRSNTWVASLEAIGYGLQGGLVNGARSVYLDSTPLEASDGSKNFRDINVDVRVGDASQAVIKGFENVGVPTTVATDVTIAAPVTRTTSSATVKSVGVTIRLPNGLYNQNTSNNTLEKTVLRFQIKVKLTSSGTYVVAVDKTYNDKTTGPYEETFRVELPAGAGTSDIRVERVTPDSGSSTLRNGLQWAYMTEYEPETLTYNNVALVGIALNAQGVNAQRIPTRSFDWYGRIIQVPNNLNTSTRVYTGSWDLATFKNDWCNDPAWVLYDLATDPYVGLGLSASQIDIAAFYAASVYNSALVSFTGADGLTYSEPRFSFNYSITEAFNPIDLLNQIAGSMNATMLWVNGQLTVVQDRPDTFSHVFTNANVIGGRFSRSGTPYDTRYTVVNVTWNAPADGYKQQVVSVQDTAMQAVYGYNETNIAAYGCTSKAQAIRYGRHFLYSSLKTPSTVTFTTGEVGALVVPGDVIRIYDNVYGGANAAGRLLTGSTTTVINLDRAVTLTAGSKITIWGIDGTITTDAAITTTGTVSTLTLTAALAAAPAEGSIFQITTSTIVPETYRVMSREEKEPGQFLITAGQYDSAKWTYIEGSLTLAKPIYSNPVRQFVTAPTGLTALEKITYSNLSVNRVLHISWTQGVNQVVSGYRVTYSINGGTKNVVDVRMPYLEIDVVPGSVAISVQSLSMNSTPSTATTMTYTVAATEGTGSTLNAPTSLVVVGTAGTTFTTRDLLVQWTNPTSNGTVKDSVARFKVEVYNGATLLRTTYVEPVAPGQTQTYTYAYDDNVADGGPRRSLIIKVYCQDGSLKLSSAVTATFTNAVPAAISGITATSVLDSIKLTYTLPTDADFAGVLIWRSTTSGFTPSSGNLIYDGSDSYVSDNGLTPSTTYYYKLAAYDDFSKDLTGATLNISAQYSGIPSGLVANQLADGAVITTKIAAGAIDASKTATRRWQIL